MQFNLRAASGADEMRIEHTRRCSAGRRSAGDLRYTYESGHSVAAQYLSLRATSRQMLKTREAPQFAKFHEQQNSPACIGGHLRVP